jgi:hypothetical protein
MLFMPCVIPLFEKKKNVWQPWKQKRERTQQSPALFSLCCLEEKWPPGATVASSSLMSSLSIYLSLSLSLSLSPPILSSLQIHSPKEFPRGNGNPCQEFLHGKL